MPPAPATLQQQIAPTAPVTGELTVMFASVSGVVAIRPPQTLTQFWKFRNAKNTTRYCKLYQVRFPTETFSSKIIPEYRFFMASRKNKCQQEIQPRKLNYYPDIGKTEPRRDSAQMHIRPHPSLGPRRLFYAEALRTSPKEYQKYCSMRYVLHGGGNAVRYGPKRMYCPVAPVV